MSSQSSDKVILYDLPTKKPGIGCWSPNVWKTRLLLNYKQIPYTTTFLLHQEIGSTLSSIGLPPNPPKKEGTPGPQPSAYTVPAIKFPNGEAAMDSPVVALEVNKRYPEPRLDMAEELQAKAMPILGEILPALLGEFYPRIQRDILLPEVVEGWTRKKEAMFGMSMAEFQAQRGGEVAWGKAKPGFEKLRAFLQEGGGPFVKGKEVTYLDFVLAALMESVKRIGEDMFERLYGEVPELKILHGEVEGRGLFGRDD